MAEGQVWEFYKKAMEVFLTQRPGHEDKMYVRAVNENAMKRFGLSQEELDEAISPAEQMKSVHVVRAYLEKAAERAEEIEAKKAERLAIAMWFVELYYYLVDEGKKYIFGEFKGLKQEWPPFEDPVEMATEVMESGTEDDWTACNLNHGVLTVACSKMRPGLIRDAKERRKAHEDAVRREQEARSIEQCVEFINAHEEANGFWMDDKELEKKPLAALTSLSSTMADSMISASKGGFATGMMKRACLQVLRDRWAELTREIRAKENEVLQDLDQLLDLELGMGMPGDDDEDPDEAEAEMAEVSEAVGSDVVPEPAKSTAADKFRKRQEKREADRQRTADAKARANVGSGTEGKGRSFKKNKK